MLRRQDNGRPERRGSHIELGPGLPPQMQPNCLRRAVEVDRVAGFQEEFFRTGAFGYCHDSRPGQHYLQSIKSIAWTSKELFVTTVLAHQGRCVLVTPGYGSVGAESTGLRQACA